MSFKPGDRVRVRDDGWYGLSGCASDANHPFNKQPLIVREFRIADSMLFFENGIGGWCANRFDLDDGARPALEKRSGFTALVIPQDVPNCCDRTCSGAMYERSQASRNALMLQDARGECAALERAMVKIRDEAALEIAWLKRELQRNDPKLYRARYERRASDTKGASK